MANARIIAFYLPQYHRTAINDRWYGEGFTEWTNVRKARPLFRGHDQPRVPADELGYYDLSRPETREIQARLAGEAGVEGFCYYHYWFSRDHQELSMPMQEVLRTGAPAFPFCLCWANQSWYSKFWNKDAECVPKLIAEQKYDDAEGNEAHFLSLLPAFRDPRYIRINGKNLFMIYRPLDFPEVGKFMEQWQALARKHGLPPFHFAGQATKDETARKIIQLGFDGVNILRKNDFVKHFPWKLVKLFCRMRKVPFHVPYGKIMRWFFRADGPEVLSEKVYPSLIPNWDHSPRSGRFGSVFTGSAPDLFRKHAEQVLAACRNKTPENNLIFLKSWNEWGEGNYMEPDTHYGKGYIEALRQAVNSVGDH